jgi:hypothetical protein
MRFQVPRSRFQVRVRGSRFGSGFGVRVAMAVTFGVGAALLSWTTTIAQRPVGDASAEAAIVIGGCEMRDAVSFHRCATEKARTYRLGRLAGNVPDLRGYWRSRNLNAAYNVEKAPAEFGIPASGGHIIDTADGLIPYKPEALARRNELRGRGFDDPQAHCAPSGAPRKGVTLFGWKIIQPAGHVVFLYESMHDYRVIPTDNRPHLPARMKLWHGDPVGRWEGNTLVVDYRNINGRQWYDMSGNFQTEHTHVVERYTRFDDNGVLFEARIEDDTIYTKPWTLSFALERNTEEGYYQLEYACHEGERDLQHLDGN